MKNLGKLIVKVLPVAVVIMAACCGGKQTVVESGKQERTLTEEEQREYNYALTEATKLKVFGNLKQAADLFRKCIEVNPGGDVAFYELGNIHIRLGDLNSAKEYTKKAVGLNKMNYWYYLQLVHLYQYEGNRDSTIRIYEEINSKWPGKVNVQYELARNYALAKKYDQSIELLDTIERQNGISGKVSLLKEQIYAERGNIEKAIEEMLKLIEAEPDDIRFIGLLAELYSDAGKTEKAKELYERLFDIDPENGLAQLSIAEFYKELDQQDNRFIYLERAFDNEKLEIDKKLEQLIIMLSSETEMQRNKSRIEGLIQILLGEYPEEYRIRAAYGDFLVKDGRYDEAIKQFEQAIEKGKDNYILWEQLIYLYNMQGNEKRAYERSVEALELFPEKPFFYLFKGSTEHARKKYKESIQTLERGLNFTGDNNNQRLQFYSYLAEAYRAVQNYERSDACFEMALSIEPENVILLNNYSYYLAVRGEKLDEAERMSSKTIIRHPKNPTYLDTYAWIMFKKQKKRKALEYIEKAINNGGNEDPDILEHYGDILMRLGKVREAVKIWERAIDYGAERERISEKINRK